MSASDQCKSLCVPDTCSLIFAAQIRLKGKTIFEWLLDQYEVKICPKVKTECFEQIQSRRDEFENINTLKSEISKIESREDFRECLKYLDCYCERKKLHKFLKVNDGERQTFAFALHLSLKLRKPAILLTDDFPALESFAEILNEQKFAIAKSLPDYIINTFQTMPDIDQYATQSTLQSYYNLMKRVDLRKRIFDERMNLSCRSLWLENCYGKCFG